MKKRIFLASTLTLFLASLSNLRAAEAVVSNPASTQLGVIDGGDAGEGLDLQGEFIYALSFGADPSLSVQIGDATFLGLVTDEVPGANLTAGNTIPNWYVVDYGESANDDNLELATSSIRWSDANNADIKQVTLVLDGIQVGAQYKLQLIFGEECCNRGFDVHVEGALIVKDFNPGVLHGGSGSGLQSALITHTLSATAATLTIILDGTTASSDYPDHNAIFNALTVEKTGAVGDSDGDGLADTWEQFYFSNLAQTAAGDPDGDGLTNTEELAANSNPTLADTDSDGLTDSAEVKTHRTNPNSRDSDSDGLPDADEVNVSKTDPLKADTDGDLLPDAAEIRQYSTDPLKTDTDGDTWSDYAEIHLLTDARDSAKKPVKTTANLFTGPDAGEGLDFQGTFPYAISFGNELPGGQVYDALFTHDAIDGFTVVASQVANDWNVGVNYGDTAEEQVLSSVMGSIRWSNAGNATTAEVTATFGNLTVGATYKAQLLFAERLWARGFDISANGRLIAQAFAPFQWQGGFTGEGGATPRNSGVVVTHNFVANRTDSVFVMDGEPVTDPAMPDHNAIINGATLELVAPPTDTDSDGLWDAWETEVFGNLSQTSAGDPDSDGLTNAQEFTNGTDPNAADTDGDGINDGSEINTSKTNPLARDTDGDGLSDGAEVNTHKTDPLKPDGDEDGLPDGLEVITTGPASRISNVLVQAFTGGDPGEGLDLQGRFRYAVNVSSAGPAGRAGDADFTADNVPGITVTAPNNIPNWDTPEYGDTEADNAIEMVTQSIRYGSTVQVLIEGLVPGSQYRLQSLFYEQCCFTRGFNIYVDGELVALDFSPPNIQGGANPISVGAMVSADIETSRDKMSILYTTFGRTDPSLTDPNAILDGFTLEALREVQVVVPTLSLNRAANGTVTISTDGTLQSSDTVNGPYTSLPNNSVVVDPAAVGGKPQQFYRATR